jgi:hypothetical protein
MWDSSAAGDVVCAAGKAVMYGWREGDDQCDCRYDGSTLSACGKRVSWTNEMEQTVPVRRQN